MASASKNATCPGCKTSFTYSGLSRHLARSYDIRCVAARQDIEGYGVDGPDNELQEPPEDEPQLQQFQGDFFGDNYQ